jgi:hypothetical protein
MPHVNVMLYPGRWAEEKAELACEHRRMRCSNTAPPAELFRL